MSRSFADTYRLRTASLTTKQLYPPIFNGFLRFLKIALSVVKMWVWSPERSPKSDEDVAPNPDQMVIAIAGRFVPLMYSNRERAKLQPSSILGFHEASKGSVL